MLPGRGFSLLDVPPSALQTGEGSSECSLAVVTRMVFLLITLVVFLVLRQRPGQTRPDETVTRVPPAVCLTTRIWSSLPSHNNGGRRGAHTWATFAGTAMPEPNATPDRRSHQWPPPSQLKDMFRAPNVETSSHILVHPVKPLAMPCAFGGLDGLHFALSLPPRPPC